MIILILLLEYGIKISKVESRLGVIIRDNSNTESNLIISIFLNLISLIIVFFLLFKPVFELKIFLLRTIIRIKMVEYNLTFEINIMIDLYKMD